MFRFACVIALTLLVVLAAGCGGGGGQPPVDPVRDGITVSISPTGLTLQANEQYQFTASASGGTNSAVTWIITDEVDGGIITPTSSTAATYQAPSTDGHTVHIRATSVEDTTKYAVAIVTISGVGEPPSGNNGVEVVVSPKEVFLPSGVQAQFTATVVGHSNTSVTWSIDEPNAGMIEQDGTYTAPSGSCVATIRATSQADPTKSDTAIVVVIPGGGPPLPPGG